MKRIIVLCVFVFIGLFVYWNSLANTFHYDDEVVVVFNRNITSLRNIPYFFKDPRMMFADPHLGGHYRPLVVTAYALSYAIGGLNPVPYHLLNLFLHIGSSFLIFLIVKAILENNSGIIPPLKRDGTGDDGLFLKSIFLSALSAGLIFLVHPFNSEAVNYVTALSSIMSGFFYLLGFYCWVRYRQVGVSSEQVAEEPAAYYQLPATTFYIASLLAFGVGMLSKEVVITLPIVFWLYDLFFKSIPHSAFRIPHFLKWRTCIPYIPFVLLVVIPYLLIRLFSMGKVLDPFSRDIWTQLYTELPVLVKHWQMFFIPAYLTPHHFVEIYRTYWSFPVIVSSIIIIGYLVTAFLLPSLGGLFSRGISFFMFWFLIVLLPTTMIPLNDIFQENRGYLAIVSFSVLAGVVIGVLYKTRAGRGAVVILMVLIIVYSSLSFQRNKMWKDDITLWNDALEKAPRSPEVYTVLAIAYRRAGMYGRSIYASQKALVLGGKNNFFIHDSLGRIYMDQKKLNLSAEEFEKAIKGYPYKADTHNELGTVYFRLDKSDLAEKEYKEAIRLDPRFYRPYYNLGLLYDTKGKFSDAVTAYKAALSLNQGHLKSLFNLGILMEEMGNKGEALKYYNRAVQLTASEDEKDIAKEVLRRLEQLKITEQ